MRVVVIGTGYVGLTTGACFASLGHDVVCTDVSVEKIQMLQRGEVPILEDGLDEIITEATAAGKLRFQVGTKDVAPWAEVVYLCVPTPQSPSGHADMRYVDAAIEEIRDVLVPGTVVVNKCTSPVGSVHRISLLLDRSDVAVVSNPEFLREGTGVMDFLQPDRVVVGGDDPQAVQKVMDLYEKLGGERVATDARSAEMIKYACNTFIATKLSFVNALSALCESMGADIMDVAKGMGLDPRIGATFLMPGPGWGGSCFPKDTQALMAMSREAGYDFDLLQGTIDTNQRQLLRMASKIEKTVARKREMVGARVAVWGATFKANTNDLRDSPAVWVMEELVRRGCSVSVYDPSLTSEVGVAGVTTSNDMYGVLADADALVILTEWDAFRNADLERVAQTLRGGVVDTRNVWDPQSAASAGVQYEGVGRGRKVTERSMVSAH